MLIQTGRKDLHICACPLCVFISISPVFSERYPTMPSSDHCRQNL